jgi:hypothetical protein
MRATNNDPRGYESAVASDHSEAAGASERSRYFISREEHFAGVVISPEMRRAGGECLDEFTSDGGALTNSSFYVAEEVYLAMEKRRRAGC